MPRSSRAGRGRFVAPLRRLRSPLGSRGTRLHSERLEERHLLTVAVAPVQLFASQGFLTAPSQDEPLAIVDRFLQDHADALQATGADLASYRVTDLYTDAHNGVTHVYLRQQLGGLDVLGADLNVNLTADGQIINVGASFVGGLADRFADFDATPSLSEIDAVRAAAGNLGYALSATPELKSLADDADDVTVVAAPGFSLDDVPVSLAWAPVAGGVELAWSMIARTPDGDHWYDLAVSADDGDLLWDNDWTENASYSALPLPVEAPSDGSFQVLTDIHDPVASPFGWHDTNGVAGPESLYTRGNNVDAASDYNQNNRNQATDEERAYGGETLEFLYAFDPTKNPFANEKASVTNLFVFTNIIHDVLYQYGFNETSGNFQVNNYGRGGMGNDAVQADALDSSGTDNANFSTPPDGLPGRMQMYRWLGPNPDRDSAFDNGIVAHEYGHGLSNRLTGGPANANALRNLQSGGMGEGWSDWLALMLLQRPEDQKLDAFGVGTYVLGQSTSGNGIRRHPYSFDMEINPHTFAVYNSSTEVHDSGEIWASALWDLNWILIDKYGYDPDIYHGDAGNNLTMQLVLDGMKLQPANPSFLQARDAILLADQALTGGENQIEIWTAFARRGMGFYAQDGGSNSTSVVESFVVPDLGLHVVSSTPADGQILTSPTSDFTITLENDVDPTSVQAGDFLLNGVPADSVTLQDAKTLVFHYANSPSAVEGVFTMTLAGDSLLRASDGDGLTPFSATFRYDTLQLAVTDIRPAAGGVVSLPLTTIEVDFNEAVAPGSLGTDDLTLNLGSVVSAELVDANTVRYSIAGVNHEDTLAVSVRGGGVTDGSGNPTLGYLTSYVLDMDTVALSSLSGFELAGSLVYGGSLAGLLGSPGDVDQATFLVDAGQRITVMLDPAATVQAVVELRAPGGALLATVAPLPGSDGVVSEVASVAGLYTISISQVGSNLGGYRVDVALNAALEAEATDGSANDTPATAQSIDGAFAQLPQGGQRAAVLGFADIQAVAVTSESEPNETIATANLAVADFAAVATSKRYAQSASGLLDAPDDVDWYFLGALNGGDNFTAAAQGAASSRGTHADTYLELWRWNNGAPVRVVKDDNSGSSKDALLFREQITIPDQYYLRVSSGDAPQAGTYELSLWLEYGATKPASGANFAGESEGNDSLDAANDLSRSWKWANYASRIDGTISFFDRDFQQVLLAAGDVLTVFAEATSPDMGVRIYDSQGQLVAQDDGSTSANRSAWLVGYTAPAAGLYYVEYLPVSPLSGSYKGNLYLAPAGDPPVPTTGDDYYRLTLADGERISLAGAVLEFGHVQVAVTDANGATLAMAAEGAQSSLDDWQAPHAGEFLIRVRGLGPYNLVATREVGFDSQANDTLASAQRFAESGQMLGGIATGDADVFHFVAAAGQLLHFETATPGDGANEPFNALDPRIELYDPSGALVASDDNSAADGRNASLSFTAATGGNYRLKIVGASGSTGDYSVSVAGKADLPTVRGVTLGNTQGAHDSYAIPGGSGEQLRTPAIGNVDSVSVAFNRHVVVSADDLTLFGAQLGGAYASTGFSYDSINHVATWMFAPFLQGEELTLTLSDDVQDALGAALDGEWENPNNLGDALSSSGAGNGAAGGAFVYRFNVLPGDANRDNQVTGADFTIWSDNFGSSPGSATFAQGDFNGDGYVTGADFTIWSDNFGTTQTDGLLPTVSPDFGLGTGPAPVNVDRETLLAPPSSQPIAAAVVPPTAQRVSQEVAVRGLKRRPAEQTFDDASDWLREDAIAALAAGRRLARHRAG